MKWLLTIILGIIMINLVSASITDVTPANGTFYNYYSNIPINFTSSAGDINVYVGDGTSWIDDDNLICNYSSSGSYSCNFTADRGSSSIFDNCESLYNFNTATLGDDTGTSPHDCGSTYGTPTFEANGGLLQGAGDFTPLDDASLNCGDVRDSLFSRSNNYTLMTWIKPTAYMLSGTPVLNQIFYKPNDEPGFDLRTLASGVSTRMSVSNVAPFGGLNAPVGFWDDKEGVWAFVAYQYLSDNTEYIYENGVLVANRDGMPGSTTGSSECIGGRCGANSPTRNLHGWMDDLLICSGEINETELDNMYKYKSGTYYFKINNSIGDTYYGHFHKDLENPIITLTEPRYESPKGYIDFTITDDYNMSVDIYLDGVIIDQIINNATINYLNTTTLSKGNYNLTIYANDSAGNTASKEKLFSVITSFQTSIKSDSNWLIRLFSDSGSFLMRLFGN